MTNPYSSRSTIVPNPVSFAIFCVVRSAFVLLVALVALSPAIACAQESVPAKQQFQEFYEPLIPALHENYGNVRFRAAVINGPRVFYARGVIGIDDFLGESPIVKWLGGRKDVVSIEDVEQARPEKEQRIANIDLIRGEIRVTAMIHSSRKNIQLVEAQRRAAFESIFGSPLVVLSPSWSVSLTRPYHSFWQDPEIDIVEFSAGPNWQSRPTKILRFEHKDVPGETFMSTFDAATGICLLEEGFGPSARPQSIRMYYEPFRSVISFPALKQVIDGQSREQILVVTEYDRDYEVTDDDFTGSEYGLIESDFPKPPVRITSGTLVKVFVFLLTTLLLLLLTVGAIAVLVKWATSKKRGSDEPR